ncbi:MarC family protein [Moraxella nasovis]|uniref:MarC family protein n=1 Tax=Moraxella nasovis TaxID=2904121 RepID=UPI001F61766F|nr:MarC family protein [Moraxella nasovis]UNU73533.1 MarC family protein [Moraxella nasovis]
MDTEFIKIFLAFLVLMNPFSALGLFLNLTKNYSVADRRKVAQIACTTIFVTIAFFALLGEFLLKFLGISIGSFQVAGGILVFLIAISMMNGDGNPVKPNEEDIEIKTTLTASAVVPLAIPMMIGPGGISTVIIYSSRPGGWFETVAIIAAGLFISLFCYSGLMAAGRLSRFLGNTGLNILSRVMGMLLAAVAVEITINGLKAILPYVMS